MIAPETLLQNRYLVLEQIGKGGMGVVYKATDQRFGSAVALKEIFLDAPHLRKAFEREARLLNHLRHPALPRVSDHFTDEDGQFIVMEFIPGADLWEMLKEKRVPFPLASVLEWADQLLDALDYLHNHEPSIIHRDIKPQNLKLTQRNHIILLDFGLAKGTPSQASRATETGSVFGYSYHYAPLEQMQGTGTDVRSDLYSLGATLYHLMTNVTPPDALSRATAVLNGQPDPLRSADKVQAQVSAAVARVLMNAMAQSAARRPPTAAAMREALREASRQTGNAARPAMIEPLAIAEDREPEGTRLGVARSTEPLTEHRLAGVAALPHDAMTVVQSAALSGKAKPSSARSHEHDSIATEVRTRLAPASQPRLSGLKISIMASVLLLVAAAAIFAFMRPSRANAPGVQTTSSPGDAATQTTDAAGVQTQAPALNTQSAAAPAPSSQQQAVPASASSTQSNPAADSQSSQPAMSDTAASQPKSQSTASTTDAASAALTPEAERAQQAEEIRRQRREQDAEYIKRERDEIDRQREREMQRSASQQQPQPQPPAGFPPPPPPPRGGPPPF